MDKRVIIENFFKINRNYIINIKLYNKLYNK